MASALRFRLPHGAYLPACFHVTEVGFLLTKQFIGCGGVERQKTVASFQLWEAGDYDHHLALPKFRHILTLFERILGREDLGIGKASKPPSVSLGQPSAARLGRRERIGQRHGVWRDALLLARRSVVVGLSVQLLLPLLEAI